MEKINLKLIYPLLLIGSLWLNHAQNKQIKELQKGSSTQTKVLAANIATDTLDFNNYNSAKNVFDNIRFRESLAGQKFKVKGTVERIEDEYVRLNEQEIAKPFIISYNLRLSDAVAIKLQIGDTINCVKTISHIGQFKYKDKKYIVIYSRD